MRQSDVGYRDTHFKSVNDSWFTQTLHIPWPCTLTSIVYEIIKGRFWTLKQTSQQQTGNYCNL